MEKDRGGTPDGSAGIQKGRKMGCEEKKARGGLLWQGGEG